jgi:hypothetical protein
MIKLSVFLLLIFSTFTLYDPNYIPINRINDPNKYRRWQEDWGWQYKNNAWNNYGFLGTSRPQPYRFQAYKNAGRVHNW